MFASLAKRTDNTKIKWRRRHHRLFVINGVESYRIFVLADDRMKIGRQIGSKSSSSLQGDGICIIVCVRRGLPFSWPAIVVLAHTTCTSNKNVLHSTFRENHYHTVREIRQSKRKTDHIPHTLLSLKICETRMHVIEMITNVRDNAIAILAMCHVCSMLFMCSHSDVVLL